MPDKIDISAEEVTAKLAKTKGNISHAARQLRVSRWWLHQFINEHAEVKDALSDIRESTLDDAETMLQTRMKQSDTLLIFFLKTQGHHRGYVERHEIGGPNQGPIQHKVDHAIDGDSAESIFDILAAAGALPPAFGDAQTQSVDAAHADGETGGLSPAPA